MHTLIISLLLTVLAIAGLLFVSFVLLRRIGDYQAEIGDELLARIFHHQSKKLAKSLR